MVEKTEYGRVVGWVTDEKGRTYNCYTKGVLNYIERLEALNKKASEKICGGCILDICECCYWSQFKEGEE